MIVFGLISSLFDFVTFYSLKYLFHADPTLFRTGWFIESLLTEIIILLVIRTRHSAFSSKPSRYLITAVVLATSVTVLIPYLGPASLAGLKPLPGLMLLSMLAIAAAYFVFSEMAKRIFFRRAT
jgi:Mg2+-importing ATPase